MSLILDALKQADSERSRGSVPGVFSPNLHDVTAAASARAPTRWPLWLLIAAAAAALAWFAWPLTPWDARQPAAPLLTPPQATVSAAPPPQATPAALADQALFKPVPAAPAPALAAAPASTLSAPAAPPLLAARVEAANPPPAAVTTPPAAAAQPQTWPRPAPAPVVPTAAELPAETRAQLPAVHISGHTYSDNPALRMLMVDGRMLVEGQAVSPGLRLERIGPHQAVFNHRGTRFSVDY